MKPRNVTNRQLGASMVEYALLVAVVAVVCLVGLSVLGRKASGGFDAALPSATTTPVAPSGGGGGGSGGSGGSGSSGGSGGGDGAAPTATTVPTTVATTATTATTVATTATTATQVTVATTAATLPAASNISASGTTRGQWWDSYGKQGAWVAGTTLYNASSRFAYVTVEVTVRYGDGRTSTSTVDDFYVPAGNSATLETYDNAYSKDGRSSNDVVAVAYRVTQVRTYDANWHEVLTPTSGPTATATAPPMPS